MKEPAPNTNLPERRCLNKIGTFFLKSWTPSFTWHSTVTLYFSVGLLAVIYGLLLSNINAQVIEIKTRYDDVCESIGDVCSVSLTISDTMAQPVYLYYGLDNFYQNHRLYIISQSVSQLAGEILQTNQAVDSCSPAVTNQDMGVIKSWGGTALDPNAIASPCGLAAKFYFNDTFSLYDSNLENVPLNESNIIWPSNVVGTQFKQSPDSANTQWINPEDEHFVIWMKSATFSDFRKLWARIDQDLLPGNYQIGITNNYNASMFGGQKYVILSTVTAFGGKNTFLPIVYFGMGIIFLMIAFFFAARSKNA